MVNYDIGNCFQCGTFQLISWLIVCDVHVGVGWEGWGGGGGAQ